MNILHNCCGLVETYLTMMNYIVLDKLGHHVSATTPLTCINIFHVLILAIFYNPHMELYEQYNRGVTQYVFYNGTRTMRKWRYGYPNI